MLCAEVVWRRPQSASAFPSPPWETAPFGVVSLLEMLNFAATDFVQLSHTFGVVAAVAENAQSWNADVVSQALSKLITHSSNLGLNATKQLCLNLLAEISLTNSPEVRAQQVKAGVISGSIAPDKMAFHVETIFRTMQAELDGLKCKAVPQERAKYIDEKWLTDGRVAQQFPRSFDELQRATTCYALGESTASVFHSMRALEPGLHSLAREFGVPFAHESWQTVIENIETAIRAVGKQKKSQARIDDETFFGNAAQHFYFLKNAWRNHAAHGRDNYSDKRALGIMEQTAEFIESLCPRLHEPTE